MTSIPFRPVLLGLALAAAGVGIARADCESDMLQLEDAMKAPNQTPEVQAAYKDGAGKAASAMRKDDDGTCHKVIADALAKAGRTLK
jgi:hypothetical protein